MADDPIHGGVAASHFCEAFAALPEDQLARHFLTDKTVRCWPAPAPTPEHVANADRVLAGQFTWIGETYRLAPGFDWAHNPSRDKEWLIALHKHYFAIDLCQAWRATGGQRYLDHWVSLTTRWLDEMGSGAIAASDAQVEAKRVESWVTAYLVLRAAQSPPQLPAGFVCRLVARLGEEAAYISRNLKPSRNHRTFQLYAMVLVGILFPELKASAGRRDQACTQLVENLLQDFTEDGIHVERSTHYHNITLETALAFVELACLNAMPPPPSLEARLRHALAFSLHAQLPDGELPLIGDSDVLDHHAMFEAGHRLYGDSRYLWAATRGGEGKAPRDLSREFGGYFILADGSDAGTSAYAARQHIFYDAAPLGEGSHAHYDLFSLCWSAGGRQVVVDPGRFTYNAEADEAGIDWRHAFKSTRAHNTIQIDGRDQTRYLSKAKRPAAGLDALDRKRHASKHGPAPEIADMAWRLGRSTDWIVATANSREYSPRHTRALVFMLRQYVVLLDHVAIDDGVGHTAVSRFHLAPEWRNRISLRHSDSASLALGDGWVIATAVAAAAAPPPRMTIANGWVSKSYGVKQAAPMLELTMHSSSSITLGSILMPRMAAGRSLVLRQMSWLPRERAAPSRLVIDLLVDGREVRDVYMLGPGADADFEIGDVRYRGRLIACRQDGQTATHVIAAPTIGACSIGTHVLPAAATPIEWIGGP